MTPAREARQLSSLIFGLSICELDTSHLDLNDYALIRDLLGQQVAQDAQFLAATRGDASMSDAEMTEQARDIVSAAESLRSTFSEKRKGGMLERFSNKMIPATPENKTMKLRERVIALKRQEETLERKLSDARSRSTAAVRSLREAEDGIIHGTIEQRELDAARKNAADAVLAVGPAETALAEHRGLLRRADELLKQAVEADQAEVARERLAEHTLFRRELSAALPGILALIERGMGIEARMRSECPKALNELAKTRKVAEGPINCAAPELALHPLTQWLEGLRMVHSEDMNQAATELLDAKEAEAAALVQRNYEKGQAQWAQQQRNRIGDYFGRVASIF